MVALFFLSSPRSEPDPPVKVVGVTTPVTCGRQSARVRRVSAYLEQNGARWPLLGKAAGAPAFSGSATRLKTVTLKPAGTRRGSERSDARIVVEAVSDDLRGSSDSVSANVKIVLRAAARAGDDAQH